MTKDIQRMGGWAHDFRNVAASLLSYADLYAVSACSKEQLLDGLRANCGWFLELVDGLVDELDGQETPPAETERLVPSIRTLVEAVADAHRLAIQARGIRLVIDIERELVPIAPSQVIIIKRILVNLLSNAIRHSHSKEIVIRVAQVATSQRGSDGWFCMLEVQDFGKGIPRQQLKRIMQGAAPNPAATVSNRRRGLSTTQNLVGALGGKLTVQSQFGKGTRCSVEFEPGRNTNADNQLETGAVAGTHAETAKPPATPDGESAPITTKSKERRPRTTPTIGFAPPPLGFADSAKSPVRQKGNRERRNPPYVLLIDDDPDLRNLISAVLLSEGIHTIAVADEALAMNCRLSDIDCVLLDLNLENARGSDVAKRLRHAGFVRPILALTAEPTNRLTDATGRLTMDPFDGWIDKSEGGGAVACRLRQLLSEEVRADQKP
jgi:CheY-like chemotaxis protein/two-component sensor histidine kinase